MRFPRWVVMVVTFALASKVLAQAPGPPPVDAAQKKQAVESLSRLLKENYVFPDVAEKTGEFLQKQLASGAYDKADNAADLAQALTNDLQAVAKDLHLKVRVRPPDEKPVADDSPEAMERMKREMRKENYGFKRVEILPGNIGYLDLRMFMSPQIAGETAVAAMNFLGNCDALIFDLRKNGGGYPEMIQLLSTYLFDQPTHLNDQYFRKDDKRDQFWTLPFAPGPKLVSVPVYILTSPQTFSGAEEFTNNLKVLKRATVVGETTGGGANPGERFPFDPFFRAFIPTGRAVNPTTGTNWEGTGVEPDIKVPEVEALAVAHLEALKALKAKAGEPKDRLRYDWSIEALAAAGSPATFTAKELASFAGTYGPRKVWIEDGHLVQQREGRSRLTLVPMTGTTFTAKGVDYVRFTFVKNEEGQVSKVVLTYDNGTRDEDARTQ
jgi:retinol-binding protein 3